MKIISEEWEDAEDFGNRNVHISGGDASSAPVKSLASVEIRRANTSATELCYFNGDVANDGGAGSSVPVTLRKKKKASRADTLGGVGDGRSSSNDKRRFDYDVHAQPLARLPKDYACVVVFKIPWY